MADTTSTERPKAKSLRPLRSLLPFLAPYRWVLVAGLLSLLVASGAMLGLPLALKGLIDKGMAAGSGATINRVSTS
jgi:ATP-binding cassette subfamily B protein